MRQDTFSKEIIYRVVAESKGNFKVGKIEFVVYLLNETKLMLLLDFAFHSYFFADLTAFILTTKNNQVSQLPAEDRLAWIGYERPSPEKVDTKISQANRVVRPSVTA
jgi:hypothetical protein